MPAVAPTPTSMTRREGDWDCPGCGDVVFRWKERCRCGTAHPDGKPAGGPPPHSRQASTGIGEKQRRNGDWDCRQCGDVVFGYKDRCRCGAPKPGGLAEFSQYFGGHSMVGGWPGMGMGGMGMLPFGMPPMSPMGQMLPPGRGMLISSNSATRRQGDWDCPQCHDVVFGYKDRCRCGQPKPLVGPYGMSAPGSAGSRPGDWICPQCNDLVFARKDRCRCGQLKPTGSALAAASYGQSQAQWMNVGRGGDKPAGAQAGGRRDGDWDCPNCGDLVFSYKDRCRCGATKVLSTTAARMTAFGCLLMACAIVICVAGQPGQ